MSETLTVFEDVVEACFVLNNVQSPRQLGSMTEQIRDVIGDLSSIDIDIDGLSNDKRALIQTAVSKLSGAYQKISSLKNSLANLAKITKDMSNGIIENIKHEKGDELEQVIDPFIDMLTTYVDELEKFREGFKQVQSDINHVEPNTREFKNTVQHLRNESSNEHQAWVSKIRAEVYGGCAASIICPLAAVAVYSIAAATLETEINKWNGRLDAFIGECNRATSTAERIQNSTQLLTKSVETELDMLQQLKSRVKKSVDTQRKMRRTAQKFNKLELNAADIKILFRHVSAIKKNLNGLIDACEYYL